MRRAAGVLAALAAHGAFLAFLLASLPPPPPPPPPAFQVELVAPTAVSPLPRRAALEAVHPETPAAVARPAAAVQPRLLERQDVAPVYVPAAPAPPAATAPAPPAAPAPAAPPQPARDDLADRLGAALRLGGCANPSLSRAERERCLEREGALAREEKSDIDRAVRRERNDAAAVARNPSPKGTALVRGPGDDPRNHPVGGPPPVMVGVVIPFGRPAKAIEPIAPSTLRGDDDALRPKPRSD